MATGPELLALIREKEEELLVLRRKYADLKKREQDGESSGGDKLSKEEVCRYSRQLIMPELGVKGQLALKKASVLIIGVGGLGCPAAAYLAAAGVGKLGLLDHDVVEVSNLQRQILHAQSRVGLHKALSGMTAVCSLNPQVDAEPIVVRLDASNAKEIISQYDVILDATDNVGTRYLINDACVMVNKPLVSGSALRTEGQLTVYNYEGGPCYRCLFPHPPPAGAVTNCEEGGVIGAGVIGTLQAMDAIKIICGLPGTYSKRMLLYDALDGNFRTIKLRPRRTDCDVCGDTPSKQELVDYVPECALTKPLEASSRISALEYKRIVDEHESHLLLDVRTAEEFAMCSFPQAVNIPMAVLANNTEAEKQLTYLTGRNVYVVCRRGNDSQQAVRMIRDIVPNAIVKDIAGGLYAWGESVDPNFPLY